MILIAKVTKNGQSQFDSHGHFRKLPMVSGLHSHSLAPLPVFLPKTPALHLSQQTAPQPAVSPWITACGVALENFAPVSMVLSVQPHPLGFLGRHPLYTVSASLLYTDNRASSWKLRKASLFFFDVTYLSLVDLWWHQLAC